MQRIRNYEVFSSKCDIYIYTFLPLHGSEIITNGGAERLWKLEGTDSETIFDRQSSTASHLNSQKHRLHA